MRILLVVPTFLYKRAYPYFLSASDFPIGVAYIASALKKAGHEVFGLNPNNKLGYPSAREMLYDQLQRSIYESQPDMIATAGLCTDYAFIRDAIKFSRKLSPKSRIVLGGGIATHDSEYISNLLNPDYCIVGEGEEAVVNLANDLSHNSDIENISYWDIHNSKHDTIIINKTNFNYPDINTREFPNYEPFGMKGMLDNYSLATRYLYRYPNPYPRPMGIVTARGCPFHCNFCTHHSGVSYRARSIENIMQEIKQLYEQYQPNILVVEDELFAVNKARVKDFCESMIANSEKYGWKIKWMFQTHASANLDTETMKLAKIAGCFFFSYGVESASPTVLASMNKKSRPEQIANAIKQSDDAGIGFGGNFIFGDPAETPETITETMNFFEKNCKQVHVNFAIVQPYPGSRIFADSIANGMIKDKKKFYEEIDEKFWNMTKMPDRLWLSWAYFFAVASGTVRWIKPTRATRYQIEKFESPMINDGKKLFNVWVKCPHCGEESHYREILYRGKLKQSGIISKVFVVLSNGKLRRNLLTYARVVIDRIISSKHPMFKLLNMVTTEEEKPMSFITGCQHCNRKLKVYLDIS